MAAHPMILQAAHDPNIIWEALDDTLVAAALDRCDSAAAGSTKPATAAAARSPPTAADLSEAPQSTTQLERLQQRLASNVPHEWTVTIHWCSSDIENNPPPPLPQPAHPSKRARTSGAGGQPPQQPQQQHPARRPPCTPGLFATAVGVPSAGVFTFGGLQPGTAPIHVKLHGQGDAWQTEAGPMRHLPDHSQVFKAGGDLAVSGGVTRASPVTMAGDDSDDAGDEAGDAGVGPGGRAAAAAVDGAGAAVGAEPSAGGADAAGAAAAAAGAAGATQDAWQLQLPHHRLSCGLVGHSAALFRGRIYIFGGQLDDKAAAYVRPAGAVRF